MMAYNKSRGAKVEVKTKSSSKTIEDIAPMIAPYIHPATVGDPENMDASEWTFDEAAAISAGATAVAVTIGNAVVAINNRIKNATRFSKPFSMTSGELSLGRRLFGNLGAIAFPCGWFGFPVPVDAPEIVYSHRMFETLEEARQAILAEGYHELRIPYTGLAGKDFAKLASVC